MMHLPDSGRHSLPYESALMCLESFNSEPRVDESKRAAFRLVLDDSVFE